MITNQYYILGDIGGTNSNFVIFDRKKNKIIDSIDFKTSDINDFVDILNLIINKNIEKNSVIVENLVLAIAGKVTSRKKKIKLTNANLIINKNEILKRTIIKRIKFMNDFTAISLDIAYNLIDNIHTSSYNNYNNYNNDYNNSKYLNNFENVLVLGPGTGLGVSYLKLNLKTHKFKIVDSEDGHLSISISNNKNKNNNDNNYVNDNDNNITNIFIKERIRSQKNFVKFLQKKLDKEDISYEDILSGRGLENIYSFLYLTKYSKLKKKDFKFEKNITANQISYLRDKEKIALETFELFFQYLLEFIFFINKKFEANRIFLVGGVVQKNYDFFINKIKLINEELSSNFKLNKIEIIKNYDVSINGLVKFVLNNY